MSAMVSLCENKRIWNFLFLVSFFAGNLFAQAPFRMTQVFPHYGGGPSVFVDLDGDGDLDAISRGGSGKTSNRFILFLINDGEGHFKDETLRRHPKTTKLDFGQILNVGDLAVLSKIIHPHS